MPHKPDVAQCVDLLQAHDAFDFDYRCSFVSVCVCFSTLFCLSNIGRVNPQVHFELLVDLRGQRHKKAGRKLANACISMQCGVIVQITSLNTYTHFFGIDYVLQYAVLTWWLNW